MVELVTILRDEDGQLAAIEIDLGSVLIFVLLVMLAAWVFFR